MRHRVGHDLNVESIGSESGYGEADAVHCDRPLVHDERREIRRKADGQPVEVGILAELLDVADRIDVPLDEVSAEPAVSPQRALQIHRASARQRPERRHADGLGSDVRVNLVLFGEDDGEAHAVDRQAVPGCELWREPRSNPQAEPAAGRLPLDQLADALNQTREHSPLSRHQDRAARFADRADPPTKKTVPEGVRRRRRRARAA